MTVPAEQPEPPHPSVLDYVAGIIAAAEAAGDEPGAIATAVLEGLSNPPSSWRLMDPAEFKAGGYLSEVNRRVLHPMGLALAAYPTLPLLMVYDERDDPEGIYFAGDAYPEVCAQERRFSSEWAKREPARVAALGYMVQETEF